MEVNSATSGPENRRKNVSDRETLKDKDGKLGDVGTQEGLSAMATLIALAATDWWAGQKRGKGQPPDGVLLPGAPEELQGILFSQLSVTL